MHGSPASPPFDGAPTAAPAGPPPVARLPRGPVVLLMLVYMFNMLDRQILTILAEPIKADLHLADWQIGAISGLAFALLYTAGGIPLSRIADRGDRVRMISVSVVVWSGFTMLCGVTRNFGEMLLARVGVGIGEAGCTPAAHSLITDYVPREKRASALAFYQLGTPLGALTGLAMGGLLLSVLSWRWAFLLAGAPGILLGAIVWFVLREPRRGVATPRSAPQVTLAAAISTLMRLRAFWCICLSSAFAAFAYFGQSTFLGSLYLRTHAGALGRMAEGAGLAPTTLLGLLLGVMVGVGGAVGTVAGGWLADRAGRRGLRGYFVVAAGSLAIAAPLYAGAPMVADMHLSLVLLGGAFLAHSFSYGSAYASIQTIAEPRMRGMALAVQILFVNMIGLALGPLVIGAASDLLRSSVGDTASLRLAMALASIPVFVAAALFVFALRFVNGDEAR